MDILSLINILCKEGNRNKRVEINFGKYPKYRIINCINIWIVNSIGFFFKINQSFRGFYIYDDVSTLFVFYS